MMDKRSSWFGRCLAAVTMAVAVPLAFAGYADLGKLMPADTNAVVSVNVADILKSPLAQEQGWKEKWENAYENGAMKVPADTIRVLGAARLKRNLESSTWQISMMEAGSEVSLENIARAEGGYTDKLWSKMAIASPNGAYFIQMGPKTLAGYHPSSDRSAVLRWVRDGDKGQGPTSEYIRGVIKSMGRGDVIIGIDLEESYSASDIRRAMEEDPFALPEGSKVDLDAMSQLLASIKNVTVRVDVADKIKAQALAEFGVDAALLEFYAKPLIKDILKRSGMDIPDIDNWKISVSGKTLKMEGDLTGPGLRSMLSMFSLPSPAQMASGQDKVSTDPAVIGEASRKYFRAVNQIIEQYSGRKDYGDVSRWLQSSAQQIDRLPVLNVDPELVAWGTDVGAKMREASTMLRSDQQQMRSKVLGVANANNNYYYDYGGNYGNYGNYNNGYGGYNQQSNVAAQQDVSRQRAQQMAQQKSETIQKASEIMGGVLTNRGKIRAQMTEKYKIEF